MARVHLIRIHPESKSDNYVAWCGYESGSNMFMTRAATSPRLCTKCSAKYAADQLKTRSVGYRLGDRLDLRSDPRRYTYKSIYPILAADDALVGHLTIKNGWGKSWNIHVLTAVTESPNSDPEPTFRIGMGHTIDRRIWLSKDAALLDVPALIESGELKSADAILNDARQIHARLRQTLIASEARSQRLAQDRAETMDRIKTGFEELLARNISNLQRTAVFDAAKLLGVALASTNREE